MADPDGAGIEWTLTADNWSGRVEVISAIDGRVTNRGVARYLELRAAISIRSRRERSGRR